MRIVELLEKKGNNVVAVKSTDQVQTAVEILGKHNFGALIVSDDGESIAGIISERDIVRSLATDPQGTTSKLVSELMTSEVVTSEPHHTVDTLMAIMTGNKIRHIPVVKDDKLAGIVSIGDVVNSRVQELEQAAADLHDYITHGR